ncbi:LysR family transcriptional regulator [Nocardia sp. NPDC051321]|uniref:LysR family transcriptional regulator n=1 Tax=Nocardia sp. NPDC051321 TaxID=3364323 RepID=UPI003791D697
MLERFELEAFLTLSEELHFTRTAERLRVTPGRISQTIKKLERQIGGPLFERTSRHTALTPLGQRLRKDLLPAYHQIQAAVETATALARGIHAVLRVGFTAAWAGNLIVRAAERFRDQYPGCTVELREVTYGAARESLGSGEIDLMLAETAIIGGDTEFVIGPTIFSRPRVLAVPSVHPLAARDSVSVEDLAQIPIIAPAGVPDAVLDIHILRHTPSGRPIPRGPVAAGWQEMLSLIGAGKGATPTCDWAADYYARPDVAFVPFSDRTPFDQALIWSPIRDTPAIQAFVHTVTELADSEDGHHIPSR